MKATSITLLTLVACCSPCLVHARPLPPPAVHALNVNNAICARTDRAIAVQTQVAAARNAQVAAAAQTSVTVHTQQVRANVVSWAQSTHATIAANGGTAEEHQAVAAQAAAAHQANIAAAQTAHQNIATVRATRAEQIGAAAQERHEANHAIHDDIRSAITGL